MATITTSAFNDSAARTAGEAMIINSGAVWTVRTDYRVHATAPASNLGSLGAITINEGELVWDSSMVRWMPFTNSGSAVVPAIGTIITQGGVSGYLLGIWASKTVAQTAVGASIPASGFMKFREVTGGQFIAGAITGIANISASGPDVQGWISLPHDVAATITVPRLGKHSARGGRFFLEDTNGTLGQIFQVPTEGSTAMFAPGLWVETDVADTYEYWPSLNGATNGWAHKHIGEAAGITDERQNFVKALAGGQLQMGESVSQASTYASFSAQSSNYVGIAHASTYIWEDNLVTVYYASGHLLETGMQTGLDFTSGGATAYDGIYTVTVLSPYHFTVPLAGSGLGGAVTSRPGITVTFTSHLLNIGESIYCIFTSGTGVEGTYPIYAVPSTSTYNINYPSTVAVTSGTVSVVHSLTITFTAHELAVGNKVYLDFTSGAGVNGYYTVKTVVDANSYRVNMPHAAAITTSNVTMRRTIGNVAPAGRKTWIGSNILNEVATGARATNTVPSAAAASRPEWLTTSAGYIDLEYIYGCSGYPNFNQPYNVRLHNCAFFDQLVITECASALDVDNTSVSMYGALDANALVLTSNFAGGTISNGKFQRGNTPGTSDHAAFLQYCKGLSLNNIQCGIIQYARSTGYPFQLSYCSDMTLTNCRSINGGIVLSTCMSSNVINHDHCDRYNGRTNITSPVYMVNIGAGCANIKVDGASFGFGSITDCHPVSGIVIYAGSEKIKVRNAGTRSLPLSGGDWAINAYGLGSISVTSGNNNTVNVQRMYVNRVRNSLYVNTNSDKNMLYESLFSGMYTNSTKTINSVAQTDLNGILKGCQLLNTVIGQSSVYGTHFQDVFIGNEKGRYVLPFNEPSIETASIFQMNSGVAKFNSAGGLLLAAIGNQATFTDPIMRYGHTGFDKTEALLSGPTQTRFNIHYAIDSGSGFGDFHNLYYQSAGGSGVSGQFTFTVTDATGLEIGDYIWGTGRTNVGKITNIVGNTITSNVANSAAVSGIIRFNHLPFETISPSTGFRLKFRLTVIAVETVACAYLRVDTTTTLDAQANNLYLLDIIKLNLINIVAGSDVTILQTNSENVLTNDEDIPGTTYTYTYTTPQTVDITIYKPGYIPFYIRNYSLGSSDTTLPPITQVIDPTYLY